MVSINFSDDFQDMVAVAPGLRVLVAGNAFRPEAMSIEGCRVRG